MRGRYAPVGAAAGRIALRNRSGSHPRGPRGGGPCRRAAARFMIGPPVGAPGPTAGGAEEAVMTEQAKRVHEPQAQGRRVVVGVDGSAGARAALRFAVEDAVRRGVPVEAVISHRPPEAWMDFDAIGDFQYDEAEAAARQRAETTIAEVLHEVGRKRVVEGKGGDLG